MVSICAVLIVRNEEAHLWQCLESAEQICDRYVIVDTGSEDHTVDLAEAWLVNHPGELLRRDWHGFARNRTEAVELARGQADYLLTLDADHVLHVDGELPELTADEYMVEVRGSLGWRLPLLLKGDRVWRYEGVAHSYLVADGLVNVENLDCLSIDGGGGVTAEKLQRDLEALTAEHARNPLDARTVFYLAQTYSDLDRPLEAIHFYRLRASMDGFAEEAFYARYRLGCLLCAHVSFQDGARELLAAWEMRPERIEPLRALATSAGNVADKAAIPDDLLFVHRDLYKAA